MHEWCPVSNFAHDVRCREFGGLERAVDDVAPSDPRLTIGQK